MRLLICNFFAAASLLTLLVVPALYAGGAKCPERRGLVTTAAAAGVAVDSGASRKAAEVVFVDSADNRVYRLNQPELAREHLGHVVTIVAHPMRFDPTMLFVHEIRCSEHKSHR